MISEDYIQVFECVCGSRTLKHMQMVPAFRTLISVNRDHSCEFNDATVADNEVDSMMEDNWTDQPDDKTSHFYCPHCGKEWPSLLIGPDSCRADGKLQYIHKNQLGVWLETEFDKNNYSWEIREHKTNHNWLFVFRQNDEVIGTQAILNWQADTAGEIMFALMHNFINPELYTTAGMSFADTDPDDCNEYMQEYTDDNSVVVCTNGDMDDSKISPWTEDLIWEFTKCTARELYDNFKVAKIPSWAVCYLVNGDMDDMDTWTPEEKQAAEEYDKTYIVLNVSTSSNLEICPWTNKLTDVYECIVQKRENSHE